MKKRYVAYVQQEDGIVRGHYEDELDVQRYVRWEQASVIDHDVHDERQRDGDECGELVQIESSIAVPYAYLLYGLLAHHYSRQRRVHVLRKSKDSVSVSYVKRTKGCFSRRREKRRKMRDEFSGTRQFVDFETLIQPVDK